MALQQNTTIGHILLINLAMFCTSTSGALGRYISIPPPLTIWWRAVCAMIFLGVYIYYKKIPLKFNFKEKGWTIFMSGVFMAAHWVTYFYALQWSNVVIAMLALFTYPVMTSLLEPLFLKTKFQKSHLALGGLVLTGIYFLSPSFDFENSITQGLLMGLISALVYALRNILLKTQIDSVNGSALMFYQMIITISVLVPVTFIYSSENVVSFFPYIIILGLITTAIGHTLFLNSFKHFTVSTASILGGMQPVYGILLAAIFLAEYPDLRNLIGGGLILSAVLIESRRSLA